MLYKKPSNFFAQNNHNMKEFKKSQFGWNVVEHYPEQKVYSVTEGKGTIWLVPEELWDALASCTNRADNYRKSRDYYSNARDVERQRCIDVSKRIDENHVRVVQDLHREINYLHDEITEAQDEVRMYKGANLALVFCVAIMSFYIFIF